MENVAVPQKQEPVRRDWLTEAIKIAEGGNFKTIRREHTIALYRAYIYECHRHQALQERLRKVVETAVKSRALNNPAKADLAAAIERAVAGKPMSDAKPEQKEG